MVNRKTYKAITATFICLSVSYDDSFLNITVDRKVLTQALIGGVVGQAANKQLCECGVFL